jgi:hypothetical protein
VTRRFAFSVAAGRRVGIAARAHVCASHALRGLDDEELGSSCAYQLFLYGHLFVPRRLALPTSNFAKSSRA